MIPVPFIPPILLHADMTRDHLVDGADLSAVLAAWHTPAADINGDGTTDGRDLAIIFTTWGLAWAVADTGDGGLWMTARDDRASWGLSPFGPAYRRLTASDMSIDERVEP